MAGKWPSGGAVSTLLRSLSALAVLVSFGAGQALFATASRGHDGRFPYNKATASLLVDALKLLVALAYVLLFEFRELRQAGWPLPPAWRREALELGALAVFYTMQNGLSFWVVESLGAGLFVLLSNMKIAWTVLFMRAFAKKRFAKTQWIGVVFLVATSVLLAADKWSSDGVRPMGSDDQQGPGSVAFGFVCIAVSTCSSGFSSVVNEMLLKRGVERSSDSDKSEVDKDPPLPFMAKGVVLYASGLALNFCGWCWAGGGAGFLDGFNLAALGAVLCMAGMGLSVAFILRYLDNVIRCFGAVMQAFVTLAVSRALPYAASEAAPGKAHAVALSLVAMALVLYTVHESPHVLQLAALAGGGALMLGTLLFGMDGREGPMSSEY